MDSIPHCPVMTIILENWMMFYQPWEVLGIFIVKSVNKHFTENLFVTIQRTEPYSAKTVLTKYISILASRSASFRVVFPVPFSKRSQYLIDKPHALFIMGQRLNSPFTAFVQARLLIFSVRLQNILGAYYSSQ